MHFLRSHFDGFTFTEIYSSIMYCIYISKILWTLAMKLGPHQKENVFNWAHTIPQASPIERCGSEGAAGEEDSWEPY